MKKAVIFLSIYFDIKITALSLRSKETTHNANYCTIAKGKQFLELTTTTNREKTP